MAYRRTSRTRARITATRERIAGAALDQVAEGGYASASVQEVARRAGVAVGTVYRHFPSKAELLAEVFRRASQRELDVVAEVAGSGGEEGPAAERPAGSGGGDRPAGERVAAAVEAFSRRALAGPVLAYALIAEPVDPAVEAERLAFRRGYRDVFARVLSDGIEAGELPHHDTQVVAAALVGALGEALVGPLSPAARGPWTAPRGHLRAGSAPAPEALVASLVQFCVGALGARQHEPKRSEMAHQRGGDGWRQ